MAAFLSFKRSTSKQTEKQNVGWNMANILGCNTMQFREGPIDLQLRGEVWVKKEDSRSKHLLLIC
jgi:hypothetical protein